MRFQLIWSEVRINKLLLDELLFSVTKRSFKFLLQIFFFSDITFRAALFTENADLYTA